MRFYVEARDLLPIRNRLLCMGRGVDVPIAKLANYFSTSAKCRDQPVFLGSSTLHALLREQARIGRGIRSAWPQHAMPVMISNLTMSHFRAVVFQFASFGFVASSV